MEVHNVDPVEEILAEFASRDLFLQLAIGGAH